MRYPKLTSLLFGSAFALLVLRATAQMATSFDLTANDNSKYGGCPSIKDIQFEGVCSASWAITTASVASDVYCSLNKTNSANKSYRFSYQDIMDCCSACFEGFDNGCFGGNFQKAMDFLVGMGATSGSQRGQTSLCKNYYFKECYLNPDYTLPCTDDQFDMNKATASCNQTCSDPSTIWPGRVKLGSFGLSRKSVAVSASSYVESMKSAIAGGNILITEMMVFEDLFAYKAGQVYIHLYGRSVGTVTVAILGYLTDNSLDYWLVRFPWGSKFGDNGYVKVLRGTNNCGIESPENHFYFST